ncbi:MAG: ATP-dependent DNA helicase RecG [Alphaproteobacteria bacterium]|jgi:ATP-dependent DNA helicase RecG|nr:ATP-dependent DNA helicase RecG [Alphaproteobacteria bacterium]
MQSSLLDLVANVNTLENIAEKTNKKLNEIGIYTVFDLLFYFPINIIIRNFCQNASELKIKEHCILKVKVLSYQKSPRRTLVVCSDSKGNLVNITFFKVFKGYLERYLPIDEEVVILGTPEFYKGVYTFNHPQVLPSSSLKTLQPIECVYRQYQGISSSSFANFIRQALNILNNCEIPEWLDEKFIKDNNFPNFKEALNNIHNPKSFADIDKDSKNITRLSIDELTSYHLNLIILRNTVNLKKGLEYNINGKLTGILEKEIPFELTGDQKTAIANIKKEFEDSTPSTILLQGDVGSGKTIVCFMAALFAIESGYQVALMSPTEILTSQHYQNFLQYAKALNVKVELLKGKEKISVRRDILYGLATGNINIVIGTHSLFQDSVSFKNLGLVIIDEQHRFGVDQRLKLLNKGNNPNLLLTTATPIPRTLALSLYGDIKYLDIKEKPKNRKPIQTNLVSKGRLGELVDGLKRAISKGEKVFWVCPLIEESEKVELTSSVLRYDYLSKELIEYASNKQLFLVHGRMSLEEKDKVLNEFKNTKEGAILVATTVIEVGIDIPESNIIIIEDAHNFGLAQLHQLRGRVGRGGEQGICILLYPEEISLTAKKRLRILKESDDGFYIAEKDMEIRGFGDILGVHQSGSQIFKIVDLEFHSSYMSSSLQYAKFLFKKITDNDEITTKKTNFLLKIFDKSKNQEYLKSG